MDFENIKTIDDLKKFGENNVFFNYKKFKNDNEYNDFLLEIFNIYFEGEQDKDAYLLASINGHLEIMKYLENEHNWNIHVKDIYGNDAYLISCKSGNLEIMKYLENKHNWDIHIKNINGCDAYLFASLSGHLEIIKYLEKEHNWDIYVKNKQGNNAYLFACYYDKIEIIKHLDKKHNWNIFIKNYDDFDALDLAEQNDNQDIIKYLKLKIRRSKYKPFIKKNKNKKCYICLEEFTKGDKYCKCQNGHIYHEDCFFNMTEDKCCVCRKENMINVIFTY